MIEVFPPAISEASTVVSAGGGSGFDMTTVLVSAAMSAPLFVWLLKMHRDLVTVVIPRGFRLIRREMRRQLDESKKRHAEHIEFMRELTDSFQRRTNRKKKVRQQRKPAGNDTTSKAKAKPTKARKKKRG